MLQEGDGKYADSEPPTANATIARFVVIGGAPPATTPSSRGYRYQTMLVFCEALCSFAAMPASNASSAAGWALAFSPQYMLGACEAAPCCQCV